MAEAGGNRKIVSWVVVASGDMQDDGRHWDVFVGGGKHLVWKRVEVSATVTCARVVEMNRRLGSRSLEFRSM